MQQAGHSGPLYCSYNYLGKQALPAPTSPINTALCQGVDHFQARTSTIIIIIILLKPINFFTLIVKGHKGHEYKLCTETEGPGTRLYQVFPFAF